MSRKSKSGNNRAYPTIEQRRAQVKKAGGDLKSDGWMNTLSGLELPGRTKTTVTMLRSCPQFCWKELDELYRADGLTRRIVDLVASEMVRQGWETDGDAEGKLIGFFENLNAYAKITQLIQWSRLYGGAVI